MKKVKLDNYEKEIEKDILKYKKVSSSEIAKIERIIQKANEEKNISSGHTH